MAATEDGVVDFLEDGIQTCRGRIAILWQAVNEDGFGSGILVCVIELFQEFRYNDVVGIEYDNDVVDLELWQV